ncbi:MAG TPA: helix-turn-helix transcriptional regulator [Streptosporangiaceae bacterium]|nr:helix-turn-helix transcriptional regulator [Streptosporangiaceae bacterium]
MSPVNVPAIGSYIREQREQAKISLRQLAQAAGVSNPYLSQIERGLRRPSADILQQIARGLRISAEALYVQAGFLEDRPPGAGVRDAVLTDPELTERQKQMLLEVYESFRKETAAARTVLAGEVEPGDGQVEPGDRQVEPGDRQVGPGDGQVEPADGQVPEDRAPEEPADGPAGPAPGVPAAGQSRPGPDVSPVPELGRDRVA